jgi:serine phosphatase RsbU (regulator of sigma subunit)
MFTFLSNIFVKINSEYDFIKESFYVVSIILISLNSLRVSWIGFLSKKQKVYLILISVVLIVVFSFNFSMISGDDSFATIISSFSPGLLTLINLVLLYGMIFSTVVFFTTLFHLPTAEAFDRKSEEVSSLIDLTKLITQVFDFKELAESVTLLTSKICNSDASWLVIKQGDEFELKSVNNIGYLEADELTKFILGQNYDMEEGVTIVTRHNLSPFVKNNNSNFNFDSIAFACLMHHEDIRGYLFAARSLEIKYDDDDRKAISAFANYAAVALENAKLIEESIEKERMEKELDVAREIQRKILPHQVPELDEYQFSALFIPAFEVGGDYYDFFKLDEENYAVVVADVSGKGISAAFIMAEVKGIFGSLSKIFSNPKELLVRVNDVLKDTLDRKTFVTSIYYVINIKTGKLSLARSGHTPALLCSNGVIQKIQPPGIGLGLDYGISFENSLKEMEISLNYNDILVLYSDGIPESKNSNFEDFGYERIEKIVSDSCHLSASEISNKIMTELTTFSLDNSQHDDITLVILKRLNNNK